MEGNELFSSTGGMAQPLARRMRPQSFAEFVGQRELFGGLEGLQRLLENGQLFSFIIYGPPGTGKSAFAMLAADQAGAEFVRLNAVTSNTAELKQEISRAADRLALHSVRTVLFIDELHRFNKQQQDALLPAVEEGTVYLVGVTTHNPRFYVNPALLSRCHLIRFQELANRDLEILVKRALEDRERGLGEREQQIAADALEVLCRGAGGDARRALNLLEIASAMQLNGNIIKAESVRAALDGGGFRHDRDGDAHYDVVSAFIKSMRGSDPDATLHYLARLIEGGEDPRFIMRRIMIAASEDVGLADSNALVVAASASQAVQETGMPEAVLIIAHAALRVAVAPKSNAVTAGISAARRDLQENGPLPVPAHLQDAHFKGAKEQGRGVGYLYPHDFPGNFVPQNYLAEQRRFYQPSESGTEKAVRQRLAELEEICNKAGLHR